MRFQTLEIRDRSHPGVGFLKAAKKPVPDPRISAPLSVAKSKGVVRGGAVEGVEHLYFAFRLEPAQWVILKPGSGLNAQISVGHVPSRKAGGSEYRRGYP